jgi:Sensors of blue-light using FAD
MPNESNGIALLWEAIQQKENYPIFRLAYLSKPSHGFTSADLDDISSKSVVANNARDVTGLLIVHDERIFQMLEGREDAVRELYSKIEADSRHTITKLVSAAEDGERFMMTWSMVVRGMAGIPVDLSEQYETLYDELLHAEGQTEITIDHIELFRALSLLGALSLKS